MLAALLTTGVTAQPPAGGVTPASASAPQPVALTLEDQFDKPAALADHRGAVVILVYGDRKGTDACKALGEQLHVWWHPTAQGLPPALAQAAPVVGLDGLAPGQAAPDVRVIPVACCGKVPGPVRGVIRSQVAKGSPEVPVWLDFADTMKTGFGLTAGEPNLAVFDAAGRLRMKVNGTPGQAALDRLVKAVLGLRADGVR
ncbi:MAG: hypothetical protein K2X87_02580 [Gemmataceae bacterium]|nr:hypothetical protein [Gemmataceae bacterium]